MIATAQIEMSAQPAQMKQGGEKGAVVGDGTLPVFADSLIVAAKAAEPAVPVVDGGKGGRRSKADEEDATTIASAREVDATGGVVVLAQVAAPQEMLPAWGLGEGSSAAGRADGSSLLAAAVALPVARAEAGGEVAASVTEGAGTAGLPVVQDISVGEVAAAPQVGGTAAVPAAGDDRSNVLTGRTAEVDALVAAAPLAVPVDMPAGVGGFEPGGGMNGGGLVRDSADAAAVVVDSGAAGAVITVPAEVLDSRALLTKAGAGLVGGVQAAGQVGLGKAVASLSLRAKATGKSGFKEGTEMKELDKSTPVKIASADVRSGDGMQSDASPQTESSVAVAVVVTHAAAVEAHAQGADRSVAAPADGGGHTVTTNDSAARAVVEVAEPVVAINTAKLLHSVGQTEMRVGMRSVEFGNISIRTSATPELMLAEISVDHGELARMLATHVPEMQARLGGTQTAHVQIEMSGQNAGGNGGQAGGSGQDAQGSRQGQGSRESSGGGSARRYERETLPAGLMNDSGSLRLDVRV